MSPAEWLISPEECKRGLVSGPPARQSRGAVLVMPSGMLAVAGAVALLPETACATTLAAYNQADQLHQDQSVAHDHSQIMAQI